MEYKWNRDQLFNLLVCFETIIDCFTAPSSFSTPARRASPELYICCSGHPWRLCYYLPVKTRKERNLDGNEAKERFSSRTLLSFWTKKMLLFFVCATIGCVRGKNFEKVRLLSNRPNYLSESVIWCSSLIPKKAIHNPVFWPSIQYKVFLFRKCFQIRQKDICTTGYFDSLPVLNISGAVQRFPKVTKSPN